jgi:hypothetical protein
VHALGVLCAVLALWCVDLVDGRLVATVRSSDRVINTLPSPVVLRYRQAFVDAGLEVQLAAGEVWYAPITTAESYTLTCRPVPPSSAATSSFSWARLRGAPSLQALVTVHTAHRDEGDVEGVSTPGSSGSSSSLNSSRVWVVGLRMRFVDASAAVNSLSDVGGARMGRAHTFDLTLYAPTVFTNALPVPLTYQVRSVGKDVVALTSVVGEGDGVVLQPSRAAGLHYTRGPKVEVWELRCGATVPVLFFVCL